MNYRKVRNNLIFLEKDDRYIIGNLEKKIFYKISDIMKDYLALCEANSCEKIRLLLNAKYTNRQVEILFEKLERIGDDIFIDHKSDTTVSVESIENRYSDVISVLTLNISRICNLRCSYCFEGSEFGQYQGLMTQHVAILAADLFFKQMDVNAVNTIIFTGGEPLVNFDIIRCIVDHVKQNHQKINFQIKTNGTLINEEIQDFLIDNNFKIQISLDGCRRAHNYHRRYRDKEDTYSKVIEVINSFIKKEYGHNINLLGTVTHQTIPFIGESYEKLRGFTGIKNYNIHSVMGDNLFALTDADYLLYVRHTFNDALLRGTSSAAIPKICGIGKWHISVDIDGIIYPCYRLSGMKEYRLGDIFGEQLDLNCLPDNLQNLYEIVNDPKCQSCFALFFCYKGCYSDKLLNPYVCCKIKNRLRNSFKSVLFEPAIYDSLLEV